MIFETDCKKCLICGVGDLVPDTSRDDIKDNIVVYGRNGMSEGIHREKRCNNRAKGSNCRASYFYGYYKYKGKKIYHQDALKNKYLISSSQSAFEIQYLYEVALDILISNCNFEGLSEKFNNLHLSNLPYDVLQKRLELNRKRLSSV